MRGITKILVATMAVASVSWADGGDLPEVGQRVVMRESSDYAGCVKFVGATTFSGGDWVGVQLDKARFFSS